MADSRLSSISSESDSRTMAHSVEASLMDLQGPVEQKKLSQQEYDAAAASMLRFEHTLEMVPNPVTISEGRDPKFEEKYWDKTSQKTEEASAVDMTGAEGSIYLGTNRTGTFQGHMPKSYDQTASRQQSDRIKENVRNEKTRSAATTRSDKSSARSKSSRSSAVSSTQTESTDHNKKQPSGKRYRPRTARSTGEHLDIFLEEHSQNKAEHANIQQDLRSNRNITTTPANGMDQKHANTTALQPQRSTDRPKLDQKPLLADPAKPCHSSATQTPTNGSQWQALTTEPQYRMPSVERRTPERKTKISETEVTVNTDSGFSSKPTFTRSVGKHTSGPSPRTGHGPPNVPNPSPYGPSKSKFSDTFENSPRTPKKRKDKGTSEPPRSARSPKSLARLAYLGPEKARSQSPRNAKVQRRDRRYPMLDQVSDTDTFESHAGFDVEMHVKHREDINSATSADHPNAGHRHRSRSRTKRPAPKPNTRGRSVVTFEDSASQQLLQSDQEVDTDRSHRTDHPLAGSGDKTSPYSYADNSEKDTNEAVDKMLDEIQQDGIGKQQKQQHQVSIDKGSVSQALLDTTDGIVGAHLHSRPHPDNKFSDIGEEPHRSHSYEPSQANPEKSQRKKTISSNSPASRSGRKTADETYSTSEYPSSRSGAGKTSKRLADGGHSTSGDDVTDDTAYLLPDKVNQLAKAYNIPDLRERFPAIAKKHAIPIHEHNESNDDSPHTEQMELSSYTK